MKIAVLAVAWVTSCGGTQPAPPAPPAPAHVVMHATPAPEWQPTAFTASVSGSGRAVILIPGLGCPASVWDDPIGHLGAGYQTHVLQLAGFAGAPAMAGNAPLVATAREQLSRYIDERHLDHPIVIGHSLGGFLAMWLAAEDPDSVGPVIDLDGGAAFTMNDPDTSRRMRDQLLNASDTDFAQATRDMFAFMFTDTKRAAPVIDLVVKSDKRAFAGALYELLTTDIRPELPKITAPVLVLLSDGPFADDMQKQVAGIPKHDTKVLAKTRHFVWYDDPKATYAAIDAFLAAHK